MTSAPATRLSACTKPSDSRASSGYNADPPTTAARAAAAADRGDEAAVRVLEDELLAGDRDAAPGPRVEEHTPPSTSNGELVDGPDTGT
jgi:hypothetical protein